MVELKMSEKLVTHVKKFKPRMKKKNGTGIS